MIGSRLVQGSFNVGDLLKISHDGQEVGRSRIKSLKIAKEKVNKATAGKECGLLFSAPVSISVGDELEVI